MESEATLPCPRAIRASARSSLKRGACAAECLRRSLHAGADAPLPTPPLCLRQKGGSQKQRCPAHARFGLQREASQALCVRCRMPATQPACRRRCTPPQPSPLPAAKGREPTHCRRPPGDAGSVISGLPFRAVMLLSPPPFCRRQRGGLGRGRLPRFPIPASPFPLPHSRFPIPASRHKPDTATVCSRPFTLQRRRSVFTFVAQHLHW